MVVPVISNYACTTNVITMIELYIFVPRHIVVAKECVYEGKRT